MDSHAPDLRFPLMTEHRVRGISLPRATGAACGHHPSGVITGEFAGFYDAAWVTWRIDEVVEAIRKGDRFSLVHEDLQRASELAVLACPDCGRETLLSASGGVTNEDLEQMPVY